MELNLGGIIALVIGKSRLFFNDMLENVEWSVKRDEYKLLNGT